MHLVAPAEGEKSEGGNVVNEHLPKVFALHVGELGEQEGPVKSHLEHVVPPNGWICKKHNKIWCKKGIGIILEVHTYCLFSGTTFLT